MSTRHQYEKRVEADLDQATAELGKLKAKVKKGEAGLEERMDDLEGSIEKLRARLKEVEEASDDTTSRFSDTVDEAWGEMKNAMRKAGATLGGREGT